MTRFTKTRSIALGLAAATAIGAATPAFAESWQRSAVAAGAAFTAGMLYGAAVADPYAYGSAYAYAPGSAYARPDQSYAYAPYGDANRNVVVGFQQYSGAPIYANELTPFCSLADKMIERC
jgi:hypothetical protein